VRFQLIDAAKEFPVQRLCTVLGVSQSGYFAWRSRLASQRQRDDLVLLAHVRSAFALSNETYGSPRVTRELQDQGLSVGRRRTARLMRENGLKARRPRRFKRTTDSLHAFPIAPNLLEQDFATERADEKWAADISYLWTREGWLYLAVVIDLFARRVVGWAVSDRLHKELALAALRQALAVRQPPAGLIHHADRGSQYCSAEYQAELHQHGILISMSGKGNCYDNALEAALRPLPPGDRLRRWLRRSSRRSRPNWSGAPCSRPGLKRMTPWPAISTASTIQSGATRRWARQPCPVRTACRQLNRSPLKQRKSTCGAARCRHR
jgi:putative transposase